MSMVNTILAAEQAKLEEAQRIVEENGMKFIKESKKYAGKHPVFDSDAFQKYLIQECGGCCGDAACKDKKKLKHTCAICGEECEKLDKNGICELCAEELNNY